MRALEYAGMSPRDPVPPWRGWTHRALGEALGMTAANAHKAAKQTHVLAGTARRMAKAFRDHPGPAPEWARRQPGGPAKAARERAA